MFSVLTLILVLVLSLIVTRIAAIALMHTGLSREYARFQARSAFTGVGHTTVEAENIVNHPVRRKIIFWLMLLGNAGFVTVISTLVITFVSPEQTANEWMKLFTLGGAILLLWGFASSTFFDRLMSKLFMKYLKKFSDLDLKDYSSLLHLSRGYQIQELFLVPKHWLIGKTLQSSRLREEGIAVLGVQKGLKEENYIGAPRADLELCPGDTIVLYGHYETLDSLSSRTPGFVGDLEHTEEKQKFRERIKEENLVELEKERSKEKSSEGERQEEKQQKAS